MLDGLFIAWAASRQRGNTKTEQLTALAKSGLSETRAQGERLQFDVEKCFMITQALWELLKSEHGYTDELLISKINEIDLSDGKLDGKVAKKERSACPSSGRKWDGIRSACIAVPKASKACLTVDVRITARTKEPTINCYLRNPHAVVVRLITQK